MWLTQKEVQRVLEQIKEEKQVNKTYTGIELLQAIEDGEIKERNKILYEI